MSQSFPFSKSLISPKSSDDGHNGASDRGDRDCGRGGLDGSGYYPALLRQKRQLGSKLFRFRF
jgi:hypothetical protein